MEKHNGNIMFSFEQFTVHNKIQLTVIFDTRNLRGRNEMYNQ